MCRELNSYNTQMDYNKYCKEKAVDFNQNFSQLAKFSKNRAALIHLQK